MQCRLLISKNLNAFYFNRIVIVLFPIKQIKLNSEQFQLKKLMSLMFIHWQCLQMNMSVIGSTVQLSWHEDDDACDDERDSDDTY